MQSEPYLLQILSWYITLSYTHPGQASIVAGVALVTCIVGASALLLEPLEYLTNIHRRDKFSEVRSPVCKVVWVLLKTLEVVSRNNCH